MCSVEIVSISRSVFELQQWAGLEKVKCKLKIGGLGSAFRGRFFAEKWLQTRFLVGRTRRKRYFFAKLRQKMLINEHFRIISSKTRCFWRLKLLKRLVELL